MDGRPGIDGDEVVDLIHFLSNSLKGKNKFKSKLFEASLTHKVVSPRKKVTLRFQQFKGSIAALSVNESKADGTDQSSLILSHFCGLGLLACYTLVSLIAVLATPHFGESFCGNTGFVEGSEAFIAAVEFSLFSTFKAVVIVEIVLVQHFFFLNDYCFFRVVLAIEMLEFGQ